MIKAALDGRRVRVGLPLGGVWPALGPRGRMEGAATPARHARNLRSLAVGLGAATAVALVGALYRGGAPGRAAQNAAFMSAPPAGSAAATTGAFRQDVVEVEPVPLDA